MDGTVVEKEDGSLVHLCDDESSLMRYLYKVRRDLSRGLSVLINISINIRKMTLHNVRKQM